MTKALVLPLVLWVCTTVLATAASAQMVTPLGFDNYDTDMNGKLNQAEYLAFLAARSAAAGERFSRTGALYAFQARDIDADGSLDFLEFLTTSDTPAPSAAATTASGSQPNKVHEFLDSMSVNVIIAVVATTTALLAIIAAVCTCKKHPEAVEANPVFAGTAVDPVTRMDMDVDPMDVDTTGLQGFSGSSIASMVSRPPSVNSTADTASYYSEARQSHQGTYLSIDLPEDGEHFNGFGGHHTMKYDGGASISQANFGRAARASMKRSNFQRSGSYVGGGGGGSLGDAGPAEEFQGFGQDVFL